MENIKFIRTIMEHSFKEDGIEFGDCIYYAMSNGNKAKVYCCSDSAEVVIINNIHGIINSQSFPFKNYFTPKKCSSNAPVWYQHIENGKWYFPQYPHVQPTITDYSLLGNTIGYYIDFMDEEE